jgi:hypothetical protein
LAGLMPAAKNRLVLEASAWHGQRGEKAWASAA